MRLARPLALLSAAALILVSCEPRHTPVGVSEDFINKPWNGALPSPGNGVPANENVEICKQGSDAKFYYTIADRVTGITKLDSINVLAGQCWVIGTEGGKGELASISEDTSYLYTLNHVDLHEVDSTGLLPVKTIAGAPGLVVTDSAGGSVKVGTQKVEGQHGFVAVFFNDASKGQIGDFVWNDLNNNGIQDAGEPGIPGLTVTLSGAVNMTTTTDGTGHYLFSNLPAGNYTVTVNPPAGFAATPSTQGSDTTKDSNGSPANVTLSTPNSTNLTVDFGFSEIPAGSIGDFVWKDLNGNGIQDAGEPGIGGITVTLSGPVMATTTTNGSGGYLFSGLPAGSYLVTVATPAGYTASPSVQGSDTTKDSNGSPSSVLLPNFTSNNLTIDFGFVPIPPAQLKVVKSPKAGTFAQNGQASFTIVVSNPSTGAPATNVNVNDALPGNGGLVWQTASTTQGTCSITSNSLVCSLGDIAAGTAVTINVASTATTPLEACTSQPNPAAVATADGGLTAQDNGALNCTPAGAQLTVNKTPDNGTFAQNGQATFNITVSNPGTGLAATNVQLNDALPGNGGLVWATASTSQGSCSITSNNLSCSLGNIAAGASVSVAVSSTTTTPLAACTSQPNPAAIATADGGLTAQDAGSLSCTPAPAQLVVNKTPDNGTFTQASQVSFNIAVSNPGTGLPATGVQLNDALPTNGGLTWASATTTQGTCSVVSNNLSCSLGDIAAGSTVNVTVASTATTPVAACTSQPNPAAIATAGGGLTAQDAGSLSCTPNPPQLSVNKTPDNGSFTQGSQVSFNITVSNPGNGAAATNVSLHDALPGNGGLVWAGATSTQGACSVTSNNLSCSLGNIAAGGSVSVTVTSTTTTPNAACTTQNNPAAIASADGGLTAQDAGSLTCTPPPPTGQIGDFVWKDLNDNGVQDAGEPGLAGITVTLSGPVNTSTVTNASGGYLFTGLPAGTYTVTVGTPGGYVASPTGHGTTATDNNGSPASVTLPTNSSTDLTIDFGFAPIPNPTTVRLCKVGTSANFNVAVNGGSATSYSYAPGQCQTVDTHNGFTPSHSVGIAETVANGTVFDSIIWTPVLQNGTTGSPTKVTTTSVTVTANDLQGALVTYYNHVLPVGGQGCSPGYWKQTQHYHSYPAGVTPNTLFGSIFENAFPGMTLVQVLSQGGGGLNALGRQIVSAYLNSYTMNYNLTTSQVVSQFNAIFPSSSKTGYDTFEAQLDNWNSNQVCNLN